MEKQHKIHPETTAFNFYVPRILFLIIQFEINVNAY